MNPDKLRKSAELTGSLAAKADMLAAADAWEAERTQATLTLRAYNTARTDMMDLRKRLEAAERLLRQIATMKNDMSADGQFTAGDAYYAQHLAEVALAGERPCDHTWMPAYSATVQSWVCGKCGARTEVVP